jgi:hypothetical protein
MCAKGRRANKTFFDMEQRWLSLARSFEFSRRLGDFSAEAGRRVTKPEQPSKA